HSCSNDNRQAVSQQLIKKGALQHTQLRIGALDVIHNDLSMSGDHGVCLDGSRIVQVSEVTEIPLGPRVDDQTPVNSNIINQCMFWPPTGRHNNISSQKDHF
uniref:Uncharacterized protein n=1 Tax=Esox lucius TaxID=8010 RepID=A0A3P8ZTZ6_ESOLU